MAAENKTKFCRHCGEKIQEDDIVCPKCGEQVQEYNRAVATPNIVINNANDNANQNVAMNMMGPMRARNKWIALALCFFLGYLGGHKFYEGKSGMGILYIFTAGVFGIGVLVDFFALLFKPNPYYVL